MLSSHVLPGPILDIRADLAPFGPTACPPWRAPEEVCESRLPRASRGVRSGRAPRASTPTTGYSVCKLVPFQLIAARLRDAAGLPPRIEASIRYLLQIVGTVLVMPSTPTGTCIPFLFNHWLTLRLPRRPTERCVSPVSSCPCGRFPSQRTGYTPLPRGFFTKGQPLPRAFFTKGQPLPRALPAKGPLFRAQQAKIRRRVAVGCGGS
jgi:hypothetical protein